MANLVDSFQYSSGSSGSSSSSKSGLPTWYLDSGKKSSGLFNNQLGAIPTGGFQGPRVAGLSPLQQFGVAQGNGFIGRASPLFNQGADLMSIAGNQMANSGTWNEAEMQRHMNPYMTGALNTMATMSNRNLMENVLPGINSTFTGAGQFGSTRNADFTNRAIRDNQDSINNASATMLNNAYGQAANDYLNWAQLGTTNANNMGTLAGQISDLGIQGLNTGMNLGQQDQANQQAMLDANKAAWTENYMFPLEFYGALSNAYNTSLGRLVPNTSSSSSSSSSNTSYASNSGVYV